jgi:hypothetical protein
MYCKYTSRSIEYSKERKDKGDQASPAVGEGPTGKAVGGVLGW